MLKSMILAVLLVGSTAAAQSVEIQLLPESPVLVTTKHTVTDPNTGLSTEIQPPWFQANVVIINKMTEDVTLSELLTTLTLTNGSVVSMKQPLNMGSPIPMYASVSLQVMYSLAGAPTPEGTTGTMTLSGQTAITGTPFQATLNFTPSL